MLIIKNNRYIKKSQAHESIFTDAFMFGYGVFETIRTYNKKIFKAKEHINRLFQSANKIELKIKYSKKQILDLLQDITKKSGLNNQKIKIIATIDNLYLISQELKIDLKIYRGVKCISTKQERELPEVKSISYLSSYLSAKKAKQKKAYEAILIDKEKSVLEGAHSNIFWFEGNTLCTNQQNVLQGITAQTVIKYSSYEVKTKKIKINDLYHKKEIFLTQTTKGIVPIIEIDNKKIGNNNPGPKTSELMSIFPSPLSEH